MAYLCYFLQDQFLRGFQEQEEVVEAEEAATLATQPSTSGAMPSRRPNMGQNSSAEQFLLFEDENHNETTNPPSAKKSKLDKKYFPQLSLPLSSIESRYDVVVIGSGYGGSIAASRSARAGQKVCVLERGKEWRPGDFPEKETETLGEIQMTHNNQKSVYGDPTGLYDLIVSPDVTVLQGCGLGGTSLINANVALECEPKIFEDEIWPQQFRDDISSLNTTDKSHVEKMLQPTTYPDHYPELPKQRAMEKVATHIADIEDLNVDRILKKTPLYVNFEERTNKVGITQPSCVGCSNCCSGCNIGAKNTLDMNYLPDAKAHGAHIFTRVEVKAILKDEASDDWCIHYVHHLPGADLFKVKEQLVRAKFVILGAGSLGSTNVLLQSKQRGLDISDNVGKHFTTNGDSLGFSFNGEDWTRPVGRNPKHVLMDGNPPGPCITTVVDMRDRPGKESYVLQDGTPPRCTKLPLKLTLKTEGNISSEDVSPFENRKQLARQFKGTDFNHSMSFLAMSNDDASGELKLGESGRVWVDYQGVGEGKNFEAVHNGMRQATEALKGDYIPNPLWGGMLAKLRNTKGVITVHPLGGCGMAESGTEGVVNHMGEVFKGVSGETHQGLFVVDGSIMPRSLGVNPSLSISMIAERCMRLLAEKYDWRINYDSWKVLETNNKPLKPGIRFTERMVGKLSVDNNKHPAEFTVTVESQDVRSMIKDKQHSASIYGIVECEGLSSKPLTVSKGYFELFSKSSEDDSRQMIYKMMLSSHEGKEYYFVGRKVVHKDSAMEIGLGDTTTLFVTIYEGLDEEGEVRATGKLLIKLGDFMKQLRTLEIFNCGGIIEKLKWKTKFIAWFAGVMWKVYGGVSTQKHDDADGDVFGRDRRVLRVPDRKVYPITTEDGKNLMLTRFQGGIKGPIILMHGMGVSKDGYLIDTIDTNLTEFLVEREYDVWLFDNRNSTYKSNNAMSQSTLDEGAEFDIPLAIDKILEVTEEQTVQVFAHCASSVMLFASLLAGKLEGKIRCIVASQATFCTVPGAANKMKSTLKLPHILHKLGVEGLSAYTDEMAKLKGKALNHFVENFADAALKVDEQCDNSVCHRVTFMYGQLYNHSNLNTLTHETLDEQFGYGNSSIFRHLSHCFAKEHLVSSKGEKTYLPDFNKVEPTQSDRYVAKMRKLDIPIFFMSGAKNKSFDTESTKRALDRCREVNPAQHYERAVIPDYGHFDCLIGQNAATDVWPRFIEFLDVYADQETCNVPVTPVTNLTRRFAVRITGTDL